MKQSKISAEKRVLSAPGSSAKKNLSDGHYIESRIRAGDKRDCSYPQNGIPKTTVSHAEIRAFFFGVKPR